MSKNIKLIALAFVGCACLFLLVYQQPSEIERAEQAIIDHRHEHAITTLNPLAENNNAQAQALLAFIYYRQNNQLEKVKQWAEKAITAQSPLGYFILANSKIRGISSGELDDSAIERENIHYLLSASAELGFTPAMLQLPFRHFKQTESLSYASIGALMSFGNQPDCFANEPQLINKLRAIKPKLASISIFEETMLQQSLSAYLATISHDCVSKNPDLPLILVELQITISSHANWFSRVFPVDSSQAHYPDSYKSATITLVEIMKNTVDKPAHFTTYYQALTTLMQLAETSYELAVTEFAGWVLQHPQRLAEAGVDENTLIKLLKNNTSATDSRPDYMLGLLYRDKQPPDLDKASHYLQRAAYEINESAIFALAELWQDSEDFNQRMASWLWRGLYADLVSDTQANLDLYLTGISVQQIVDTLWEVKPNVSKAKLSDAFIEMAEKLSQAPPPPDPSLSFPENPRLHIFAPNLKKRASENDPQSVRLAGFCYYYGENDYPIDFAQAYVYFRKAKALGISDPLMEEKMTELATQPEVVNFLSEQEALLSKYKTMAAEGNTYALMYLGEAYDKGITAEYDKEKAIQYYQMAAKKGDKDAQIWLNENVSIITKLD